MIKSMRKLRQMIESAKAKRGLETAIEPTMLRVSPEFYKALCRKAVQSMGKIGKNWLRQGGWEKDFSLKEFEGLKVEVDERIRNFEVV